MISARFSQFYIDVGAISKEKIAELDKVGISENLGFGLKRYWFKYTDIDRVEKILDDRIVVDVKHQKQHIAEIMFHDEGIGKISITMGSEAVKIDEMMKWKSIVAKILQDDHMARNSDKWLYIKVLQYMGYAVHGDYEAVLSMPNWETISRTRRKFQENDMYLADPEIEYGRRECEEQMHDINKWYPKDHELDDSDNEINRLE